MSKISTYQVVPVPKLADKLIGTSVGGEIEDITYNFTLLELLELFLPIIPANNLQGVLDYGNTATQDINLFGTITTTNLSVTDTANLFITYLNEETHLVGSLFDSVDSVGTAGQVLTSTGDGVAWFTLPPIFTPNLEQVLTEGNTADIDILLDANIEALDISADTATVSSNLTLDGTITDNNSIVGSSGQVLSSTVTGVAWVSLPVYSAISPLLFNSATGVFSIQVANSTQGGYLTANDWVTFDGKQNAGAYITALTGEATASGPGSVPITLNNASVIAKVLTGLNITGGTVTATDSILTAFGKVQNQINGLMGGVQYQGVWNANTNTPTLTSSVGVQGEYYIVNVAGATNLNGITDWQVGDWAIFSGGVWQKVDNTDLVTSVNGQVGAVSLTTDNIPEGLTNLYFTDGRARAALTATSPLLYNNISGVFSIQQSSGSQNGYLSSTDWNTFNDKQNYLGGTGLVKSTAGTITYITDNSGNWNTAYNDSIVSAAVTGTSTKTLTLNQQDGGTIQASWSDIDTGLTSVGLSMPVAFSVANTPLTSNGTLAVTAVGSATQYIRGDGQLATFPTSGGGGSSINYYLNGSVPASVVGYKQMANSAVIGGGTDFNLVGNGLIAQFLTDVGNPNRISIPGGAWNAEMFFSVSSAGGNQKFYLELLKYDGVVFTLIASGITNPEEITGGIATDLYLTSLAVPETTLLITDRLAIRVYIVDNSVGRTVTLHTEDNNLCQIITTFSGGISALNGLTANTQYFAVGTAGTDFAINSLLDTHTFNLPTSSATKRGALSNVDWITFNNKQSTITLTTLGSSGESTFISDILNIPNYTLSGLGGVPTSRQLTINGITYDLSANRTWSVGTVTSVAALTLGTSGTDLSSTVANSTTTPVITLNVPTASAANRGALSAADWSTFNTKVGGVTASSPLFSSGGSTPNITIQAASGSQNGYLSSTDWTTFNNKQAAGNYITSLTGEATASGPGAASVTLNNASVTAKVLTGINITGGTVVDTDSILTGFGKLQNQINSLIGSTIYKGTWNASTNNPALTSGVGTRGWYYIVNVAGTTNLDGITDWFIGDWAIFDGTAWQQVDNTDAVVSVNGQTGAVSLTTDNIPEGVTNQYFLNSRARASLSFAAGSGAYNSTSGLITIPTNTNQLTNGASFITLASLSGTAPIVYSNTTGAISITQAGTASNGYLSSTDWNTFNNKQPAGNYVPYTGANANVNLGIYSISAGTTSVFSSAVNLSAIFSNGGAAGNYNAIELRGGTAGTAPNWQISKDNTVANSFQIFASTLNGGTTYTTPLFTLLNTGYLTLANGLYSVNEVRVANSGYLTVYNTSLRSIAGAIGVLQLGNNNDNYILVGNTNTGGYLSIRVNVSAENAASGTEALRLNANATATFPSLAGTGTRMVVADASGILSTQAVPTGTVTGSGFTNYVSKWTSGSAIGNSLIYDDGTYVGVNTTTNNGAKFVIKGANGVPASSGTTTQAVLRLSSGTGLYNVLDFGTNESLDYSWIQSTRANSLGTYDYLAIQPNGGNLIVGSTANSTFKLDVYGTGRFSGDLSVVTVGSTAVLFDGTNPTLTLRRNNNGNASSAINFKGSVAVKWQIGTNQATGLGFEVNEGDATANRFYIAPGGAATFSNTLTTGGTINANTASAVLQVNGYAVAKYSYFGYSAGYPGVIIGQTGGSTLFFNVDVSGNPSGAFGGNGSEYVWRNVGYFITPNAINNGYNTLFSWNSSGQLSLPGLTTIAELNINSGLRIGDYTGNPTLTFAATSNGISKINFYDSNSTEGLYVRTDGESYGGTMTFGARWDDDEAKIVFKMYQTSAGGTYNARVGIGTGAINPLSMLHVCETDGGNYTGSLRVGGASGFGIVSEYTQSAATTGTMYVSPGYSNADVLFKLGAGSGNINQLVLRGNGRVGIITDAPFSLLHVGSRPGAGTTNPSLGSIATISNDGLTGIDLGGNVNANNVVGHINWVNYLGVGNYNTARIDVYADGAGNSGSLRFWTASVSSSPTIRLTISSSGAATFSSSVTADRIAIAGAVDANARLVIGEDSSTTNVGYVRLRGYDIYEGNIYKTATYGIYMDTDSNARPIRIDGSAFITGITGNVGIGTSNPLYKLEVNGTNGSIAISGSGYITNPIPMILGQYTSTIGYIQVPNQGSVQIWNGGTSTIAEFKNNSDSVFYGNVGIGISPIGKLTVKQPYTSGTTPIYFGNTSFTAWNRQSYDTMILQQDDVTSFRMVEKNGETTGSDQVLTFSIGDGLGVIATSGQPLAFYVNGSPSGLAYQGLSGTQAMRLNTNGNVQFYYSIVANGDVTAYSDISVKENIRPIENALQRITKSRGVLYDRIDSGAKNNIGFIAQELELQFPELISVNADGTKAVKYQNAVAIAFEGIKEHHKIITNQAEKISYLEKEIDELKKRIA